MIGGGAREHALAWKLSQECEVLAASGNPGISELATCVQLDDELPSFAKSAGVRLVVIGPENPLIGGLADRFRSAGLPVFGPGADGARLEGSKAFSKELMREAGVPTADFASFDQAEDAHAYVRSRNRPVVVKASGAALGKGVIVAESEADAHEAIDHMLLERAFGEAGGRIVVEDRLNGPEFSLLTLCSDGDFLSLPVAQDYKRALDGDRGPNTGGMGSFSPVAGVSERMVEATEEQVVRPILEILRHRGIGFRGVLFSGLMVDSGKVYCLEYNVRFGDPEIESLVRRIGSGFLDALLACAEGRPIPPVEILDHAAVTVMIASGGYPNAYEKGKPITIGEVPQGVQIFHAGTAVEEGHLVTNGGRVLAVSATGTSVAEARARAYEGVRAVSFDGMHFRRDIAKENETGAKSLN